MSEPIELDGCELDFTEDDPTPDDHLPFVALFADVLGDAEAVQARSAEWRELFGGDP